MNIKIDYPQPSEIEELYAHFISGSGHCAITLDKRDVNAIALHANKLLSLSATGEGEQAICEAFQSLSSALKQADISSINRVLIKIVYDDGLSIDDKEMCQLDTFMNMFNPETLFTIGYDENKLSNKEEVIICILASMIK